MQSIEDEGSRGANWSAAEFPPASDVREAVAGSRYIPSGILGHWWVASLGGIFCGASSGLAAGLLFILATGLGRRAKLLWIGMLVVAAIGVVVTAGLAHLAKVRSRAFTALIGLGTGAAFAFAFLCGAVQRGIIPRPNLSTAFSNWCAAAADVGTLWSKLDAAFPSPGVFWSIVVGAFVVAGLMSIFVAVIAEDMSNGFLYDEVQGRWLESPEVLVRTAPFEKGAESQTAPGSLIALKRIDLGGSPDAATGPAEGAKVKPRAGRVTWGEVLVHRSRFRGELEVVSRRNVTRVEKKRFLAKPKVDVSNSSFGKPFFAHASEIDAVRAAVAEAEMRRT